MSTNDVGESTASMRRRMDAQRWPDVESALTEGAELYRPTGLRDYAVRGLPEKDRRNGMMITATFVHRLEHEGRLRRIGVEVYGMAAP